MTYLLDTSVCVLALREHAGVRARLRRTLADCAVSVMTVAELRCGAGLARSPERAARVTEGFLSPLGVLHFTEREVVPFVAMRRQLRQAGIPVGDVDLMIAATARAHDLIVVTHDRDFARIPGLRVEDWTQ